MTKPLHYDVGDDFVATITLDRPERKNALDESMRVAFLDSIASATKDDRVRALIITGANGVFSSGRDLSDLSKTAPEKRGKSSESVNDDGWWHVTSCPKPVIAAVDGAAVGWGVEIATHCDVRIASTRARFGWVFVHRGLVTDTAAGTWLLPRIVGVPEAARLLYSGEFIDAEGARRIGFVQDVVPPEQLMVAARKEALRYTKGSPFAVQRMKALLYRGLNDTVSEHYQANKDAIAECFVSADHKEGIAAFLEKRPPRFTGR